MATNMAFLEEVKKTIEEFNIENVRFEFLDLNAVSRSKTIPARHFESTVKIGVGFTALPFSCDVTSDIAINTKIMKKYPSCDLLFYPDLSTFAVLPWVNDTARVFVSASVMDDKDTTEIDPRKIALAQIDELDRRGVTLFSSFEYEFWMIDETSGKCIVNGNNGNATLRLSRHQDLIDKIAKNLFKAGLDIECISSEFSKGQLEMTFCPSFGIQAADNAATFRTGVKEMAMQNGYVASFMSKPYEEEVGSSGHLNHSLWSRDGKTPMTGDPSREHGLSEIGEYWLAGLVEHAPALSFLQSPTLPCRERIEPNSFVPYNATWGIDNRTCGFRLKKKGSHGVYLENRLGSSAGNPYLCLAATIAAGLDGIDRKLSLPDPVPTNKSSADADSVPSGTRILPTEIEDAFQALKADGKIVKALGVDCVDSLEAIRRMEMEKCATTELDKYEMFRSLYFEYV